MFTIWPLIVCTSVAQPTEQNGHTLGVTLALEIRNSCAFATTAERLTPEAISPPRAVAPPPATDRRRMLRREISMKTPRCASIRSYYVYLYARAMGGRKGGWILFPYRGVPRSDTNAVVFHRVGASIAMSCRANPDGVRGEI